MCQPNNNAGKHIGLPLHRKIQWFKTMITKYLNICKKQPACQATERQNGRFHRLHGQVTQRQFYILHQLSRLTIYTFKV